MYSTMIKGKVYDFKFVKRDIDTVFKLVHKEDSITMGQLFKMRKGTWSAVGLPKNSEHMEINKGIYPVDGFRTRMDAAEFILEMYHRADYLEYNNKLPKDERLTFDEWWKKMWNNDSTGVE